MRTNRAHHPADITDAVACALTGHPQVSASLRLVQVSHDDQAVFPDHAGYADVIARFVRNVREGTTTMACTDHARVMAFQV